jgi:hypothetical protein
MRPTDLQPTDYRKLPLELFTITDLTDALGVDEAARVLNTSKRAIYTIRNTNRVGVGRLMTLIEAVRMSESACRARLVALHNMRATREQTHATQENE